jgi:succinate dehydrogenase / fumarate reductase iron-sulfur subunit
MDTTISFERQTVLTNVRVQRFDPSRDQAPRFDHYRVEVESGMTVLEVLQWIKQHQDPTLTFRAACRSSICGSCAVRVNGKAVLACSTQVIPTLVDHWRAAITVAPLRNLPVLRDLVVDIEPALQKLARLHPYLVEDPHRVPAALEEESRMSAAELHALDRVTDCILCAACVGNCPVAAVDPTYPGPFALAKAYRFSADPRDAFDLPRMQAAQDHGLWSCAQCRRCVTVCPKDTRPAVSIVRLRRRSIDQGIHDTPGSRRACAYLADVERYGQVNKPMLPVVVNGPAGWPAVEAQDRHLQAHGLPPEREVGALPGQARNARLMARVRELEAEDQA